MRGVGDDVAAVRLAGTYFVAKVDPTVEGVHFERGDLRPHAIARKAFGRAASDFAAAGAQPRWALVSLELPSRTPDGLARAIGRAVARAAHRFGIEVLGGHTSIGARREVALHVHLLGTASRTPLGRSGARRGDALLATGTFGGSRLGRHFHPRPRLEIVEKLRRTLPVHASIDVSDGLSLDAARIARASRLALILDPARIPIAAAARRLARRTGRTPLDHALGDGEDYELLLALPSSACASAQALLRRWGVKATEVGSFRRGSGLWFRGPNGALRKVQPSGYVQR